MELETVIFTCTTFFDFENKYNKNKWNCFCNAIDSILEKHTQDDLNKIKKWIIVNEYSESPKIDWVAAVHEKYPFIEVIQKTKENIGQAHSLNIILEEIKKYTYWIHWEESWYCKSSCLNRMFDVIHNTNITQLSCTQLNGTVNWIKSDNHPTCLNKTINETEFYEILASIKVHEYLKEKASKLENYFYEDGDCVFKNWPLYSLRPSINRVSCYTFGDFSTNPEHWPFRFEWDFGRRWLLAGNTKAILPDGPIMRDEKNHISTWIK
jgi:hypothetical protein